MERGIEIVVRRAIGPVMGGFEVETVDPSGFGIRTRGGPKGDVVTTVYGGAPTGDLSKTLDAHWTQVAARWSALGGRMRAVDRVTRWAAPGLTALWVVGELTAGLWGKDLSNLDVRQELVQNLEQWAWATARSALIGVLSRWFLRWGLSRAKDRIMQQLGL